MNQKLLRHVLFTLSLISVINVNYAQTSSQKGINVGAKIGVSKLLGEIPYGFTEIINEFDNKTGLASAFELSSYVSPRWEIGTEVGYTILNGNSYNPEFSAEGLQYGIPEDITEPVEYKNKLLGFNLFFRYFFKPASSESVFIPFIRAGGGILNYNSQFKYIDAPDDELIFGKGTTGYTNLITPVFFLGTGFKTPLSSLFYLVISVDFNLVPYDFVDVMHNYNNEGTRIELFGLYTEFKIGIFYTIQKSGGGKNNHKKGKRSSLSSKNYLPYSH